LTAAVVVSIFRVVATDSWPAAAPAADSLRLPLKNEVLFLCSVGSI
jgi:hypothetical protein